MEHHTIAALAAGVSSSAREFVPSYMTSAHDISLLALTTSLTHAVSLPTVEYVRRCVREGQPQPLSGLGASRSPAPRDDSAAAPACFASSASAPPQTRLLLSSLRHMLRQAQTGLQLRRETRCAQAHLRCQLLPDSKVLRDSGRLLSCTRSRLCHAQHAGSADRVQRGMHGVASLVQASAHLTMDAGQGRGPCALSR